MPAAPRRIGRKSSDATRRRPGPRGRIGSIRIAAWPQRHHHSSPGIYNSHHNHNKETVMKPCSVLKLAALAAGISSSLPVAAENIRIAYIDPLSGAFGPQGASMLQHLQFVADRANRE